MPALARQIGLVAALLTLFLRLLAASSLEHAIVVAAVVGATTALAATAVGTAVTRARRATASSAPPSDRSASVS